MTDDELKLIKEEYDKLSPEVKEVLSELRLTWAGKLFFASVAAYLASSAVAPKLPIKVRGNPQEMQALTDAIMSSKEFQSKIRKPGARVEDVLRSMNLKNMSRQRFKQLTGKDWPL